MIIQTINPASEEIIAEYEEFTPEEIQTTLEKSYSRYNSWSRTSFAERQRLMINAANILRSNVETFSELITAEMGKPIAQAEAEVAKCAWVCEYYAENAEKILKSRTINTAAKHSYSAYRPIGPVLAIMPWNFPFWQVFRFAAPALMAGNVGLLKHSRNTMGCAIEIEKIFIDAGFPDDCFSNLLIGSKPIESIISNKLVSAVTLTGSTPVGSQVAMQAGKYLKKTVLELGGSDPYIVLEDADLSIAVPACAEARLINSGQSCVAAKRFIVAEKIYDRFLNQFAEYFATKQMGDPFDRSNSIGPQARKDLQLESHHQVVKSIADGARLVYGVDNARYLDERGFYFPPTILADVNNTMPAYTEELFGPVAAVIPAKTEAEAIDIANDTQFGLGAAIFTQDEERGRYLAEFEINAGACFVNDFVKSDPRLPFGGIKESGYGRELGEDGIKEFMNIKTIVVK